MQLQATSEDPVTIEEKVFRPEEAAFVSMQRDCFLATVRPDGRPHVVPIGAVLDLDRLVFATERETQKVRNIEHEPAVAICFDEYHEDWSQLVQVIVEGEAYILDGGFEFDRDRTLLYEKYPQYEDRAPIEEGSTVIVEVRVDRVSSSWRWHRLITSGWWTGLRARRRSPRPSPCAEPGPLPGWHGARRDTDGRAHRRRGRGPRPPTA